MVLRSGLAPAVRTLATLLLALVLAAPAAARSSAETAWQQARLAAERGNLELAERTVDEALQRAGKSDDAAVWALRMLRADLLAQTGRRKEARQILETPLPPHIRNTEVDVRRLVSLAIIGYYFERDESAIALLDKAFAIASTRAPRALPAVLIMRGGLKEGSDADLIEAARLATKTGDELVALKAESNLVLYYARKGRYDEAVRRGQKLLPRLDQLGFKRSATTTAGNLGWAWFELGDYEAAEEYLVRAARDAARTERLLWLTHLGNLHFVRRDWARAAAIYRDVIDLSRAEGHRELGHALANLARVFIESGQYDQASRTVAEALEIERKAGDTADILRMSIIEARVDAFLGRSAKAEKTLLRVIRETGESDVRFEAQARLAQLYARLKRDQLASQYFGLAIDAAGEARKRVRDSELRFSFFNTVGEVFGDAIDFHVASGRIEDALAVAETGRAQTLEEGLGVAVAARRLDPRAVARESEATILYYWLGRSRSYLWVVTPVAVRVHALPSDREIENAVQSYGRKLLGTLGTLKMSAADGQTLYRMLLAPAAQTITAGSKVIVIADGKLHALNFETLVVPAAQGRPPHYWIEDAVVESAGSLRLLSRRESRRSGAPAMLLVGNPAQADPSFPRLERAGEEISTVARHFQRPTILDKAKATPAAYRAAAPGKFDYVHFVAHGVATRRRPLDSAVILARDASDYRLLARDVMKQPLRARLVTISSCHGAGTRTYAGEGLVGLAWAFLHAGSEQVIAALWEVSDNATPELMNTMYAGIRAGRAPAVALRDAKLKLVRSKSAYSRPKYWAPFVLYAGS